MILRGCVALAPLGLMLIVAVAADAAPARSHPAHDAPDVFLGFSHLHAGDAGENGFELTGSFPFRGRLRLVADASLHSGTFGLADLSQLLVLAGAGTTGRFHSLRPFARALVGIGHAKTTQSGTSNSDSHTGIAFGLGGGVMYPLTKKVGVRGQADLLFVDGANGMDTDWRYAVGLQYRFGP